MKQLAEFPAIIVVLLKHLPFHYFLFTKLNFLFTKLNICINKESSNFHFSSITQKWSKAKGKFHFSTEIHQYKHKQNASFRNDGNFPKPCPYES